MARRIRRAGRSFVDGALNPLYSARIPNPAKAPWRLADSLEVPLNLEQAAGRRHHSIFLDTDGSMVLPCVWR